MRLSRLQWGLLVLVGVLALILLTPMGVAASWLGVTARSSQGVIAIGALRDAGWGRAAIGDINVQLMPSQLLLGRVAFDLSRGEAPGAPGVSGSVGRSLGGVFTDSLSATIDGRAVADDLEGSDLRLEGVSVQFGKQRCLSASGVVRLDMGRTPLDSIIKGDMIGNVSCSTGDLLLSLMSQSTMEKLVLRLKGNRTYHATLMIMEPPPETVVALTQAGFQPVAGGYRLVRSGKLR
jgi:general secretion pathway protein N